MTQETDDAATATDAPERIEVQRAIAADAAAIFRVVSDPQGHVAIDASGMLMSASGSPAKAVDDTFVVHMDREALNDFPLGLCDVTVRIVTFELDREIAISEGALRATLGILARTVAPGVPRPILDAAT